MPICCEQTISCICAAKFPMPSVVEEAKELVGRPDVRLMSLMDHTQGQRQFRDEGKLRAYYPRQGCRHDRRRTRYAV